MVGSALSFLFNRFLFFVSSPMDLLELSSTIPYSKHLISKQVMVNQIRSQTHE